MKLLIIWAYCLYFAFSQPIPHASREIRIVAPSFQVVNLYTLNVAVARLRADFAKAEYSSFIEKDGNLYEWRYYYAGTPEERTTDLVDGIFRDTSKSIIWALTGGRNSAEIFEYFPIDRNSDIKRPLYFFGFSDITALHYYFSNFYPNIKTIHGDNAEGIPYQSHAINYLLMKDIMDGKKVKIVDIQALNPLAANIVKLDNATVLGGNIALTQRSLKTKWQPDFTNKIVILEEIGETPSQLERMLNHIKAIGLFNNARAIIFGQVIEAAVKDSKKKKDAMDVLYELYELHDYYELKKYLDIHIDLAGELQPGLPTFDYLDLESKIGVEELPQEAKARFVVPFESDDDVTRLEATLLHFYQSKYIQNTTRIEILWDPLIKQSSRLEIKTTDSVLRNFANKINIPVFKSEAFGHRSYNLPIPFGTSASLYSEKTIGCQGSCSNFILEVNSPFL